MKSEMLETLLLDRALGELTPEVAALLDAYLAQNPAAARSAAELDETLRLSRAVLPARHETPRPLDVDRLRRAHHSVRSRTWRTQILRLAACLVFGLVAGWTLRPAREAATRPVVITVVAPPRNTEPVTQFWSIDRFATEATQRQTRKKP